MWAIANILAYEKKLTSFQCQLFWTKWWTAFQDNVRRTIFWMLLLWPEAYSAWILWTCLDFFLSASLNWKYFLPWSEKDNNIIFFSLLVNPLSSLGNHSSNTAFPITELEQSYHGNWANLPMCSFSFAFGPVSFSASTDSLEHLGLYGAPVSSGYTALVVPKKNK